MIRTSYPVPPIAQIRLRWELAMRRTRRALEQRRRTLAETGEARGGQYLRLRWRADLKRERAEYDSFFNQFDALIGLLCLAAQEGIAPGMEQEFRQRRAWFVSHYPRMKGYVTAHLEADPSDTPAGGWGRRACDAFEAMFAPHTLTTVLEGDGGNLIGRLCRTQAALAAWESSLAGREETLRAAVS